VNNPLYRSEVDELRFQEQSCITRIASIKRKLANGSDSVKTSLIHIDTLEVIRVSLPRRALVMVLEWASEHRAELNEDWKLCSALATPKPISPLE